MVHLSPVLCPDRQGVVHVLFPATLNFRIPFNPIQILLCHPSNRSYHISEPSLPKNSLPREFLSRGDQDEPKPIRAFLRGGGTPRGAHGQPSDPLHNHWHCLFFFSPLFFPLCALLPRPLLPKPLRAALNPGLARHCSSPG